MCGKVVVPIAVVAVVTVRGISQGRCVPADRVLSSSFSVLLISGLSFSDMPRLLRSMALAVLGVL